jgi:hypothetical protein
MTVLGWKAGFDAGPVSGPSALDPSETLGASADGLRARRQLRDRINLPKAAIISVSITGKSLRPATGCLRL